MMKIMFVCHGNICRSPMAEFVFADMVKKRALADKFEVASCATSCEELGNPVHHGTRTKLAQQEICAMLMTHGTRAILTVCMTILPADARHF